MNSAEAVEVPEFATTKPCLKSTKRGRKKARKRFYAAFHKLMRKDPVARAKRHPKPIRTWLFVRRWTAS